MSRRPQPLVVTITSCFLTRAQIARMLPRLVRGVGRVLRQSRQRARLYEERIEQARRLAE